MTTPAPPPSPSDLVFRETEALARPQDAQAQLSHGAALHAAGQTERALVAFEKALALAPRDIHAASACAAALFELAQPQAAYRVLDSVRDLLLASADGAANLAIVAEACGDAAQARAGYERALALEPNHLRALNNLGLIAAHEGRWDTALAYAGRCVELLPGEPSLWINWCDLLTRARRYAEALAQLELATRRFPAIPELGLRRAVVLAFNAKFERSQAAFQALGPGALALLRDFLATATAANDRPVRKAPTTLPDPHEMFCQQAFEAMQVCDWHDHDRLTAAIRAMLAQAMRTGEGRDWRDTQFYGLMLPLHEDELARIRQISIATIGANLKTPMPAFIARRSRNDDGRIHVGLAAQSLRDERCANALARQLALHDASRFAIHVYSPTPRPEARLTEALAPYAASIVEIAHLTDDEAVRRIRLDPLDIFIDTAFDTPWCRPEIPERRVAPVQIRQTTWHRHHPSRPCEYNMSDTFVHPRTDDVARYGAVVRLPHTCWLATNDDTADAAPLTRADVGLPGDALVLCAHLPALMIDPASFALWMRMLRALPDAVLVLPGYAPQARHNLAREAEAAGVRPARLVFTGRAGRSDTLARMRLAELFVDTLRVNANHGLADALRMGVPALSCAGDSMASRLGGSIIRAAGLSDCVHDNPEAYLDAVIALGRDRSALAALRARLQAAQATAPLFSPAARVREWEAAWTHMAERTRAGLAPAAFDVPSSTSSAKP